MRGPIGAGGVACVINRVIISVINPVVSCLTASTGKGQGWHFWTSTGSVTRFINSAISSVIISVINSVIISVNNRFIIRAINIVIISVKVRIG